LLEHWLLSMLFRRIEHIVRYSTHVTVLGLGNIGIGYIKHVLLVFRQGRDEERVQVSSLVVDILSNH
jgi:hypothetical protein